MRQEWQHWQDPNTKTLYHVNARGIRQHNRLWVDYDRKDYQGVQSLPSTTVPVDVEDNGATWRVRPHYNRWTTETQTTQPQEVHEEIKLMDEWERQLLQNIEILVPIERISQPIRQHIIIASDGSVKDNQASYGWVLATDDGIRLIHCKGPAYGYCPTSYRAEGYGLLSAICFIHYSRHKWKWNNQYKIICDNRGMILTMQEQLRIEDTYLNITLSAEWDLISEMRQTINTNKMWESIQFCHIKGHADRDQPYHKLSIMQQMNVDANKLTGESIVGA